MLTNLQLDIHYTFKQVKRLEAALTHSSFVNESPEPVQHNERLEFLGDAVLELCISDILFRTFPEAREGELTAIRSSLVNQPSLAALARRLKLDKCLRLGRGEEGQGGRKRDALLSDAMEALFGAVFMDGGFAEARRVIETLFAQDLPCQSNNRAAKDDKSLLQERTQKLYQERPVYNLVESFGPEHAKLFRVSLALPDGKVFTAEGPSVKRAEQAVAAKALAELQRE